MKGERAREAVHIQWNPARRNESEDFRDAPYPRETVRRAVEAHTRTAVSQDGWKLCLSDGDRHQLFNLEKDPWETTNLFYSGGHREVVRRLARDIRDWQLRVKDPVKLVPPL